MLDPRRIDMSGMLRDPYTRPLLQALVWQIVFIAAYSMVLDSGMHLQACCKISLAFWLGTILILVRRPRSPTLSDLAYIRWALVPIAVVGTEGFLIVWKAKGY